MKKPLTVSKAKKRAWDAFSIYMRTKECIRTTGCPEWGLCITCGKRYHIKLLQCGHLVSGRHNSGLLDEEATSCQCYNCNINLKGATLIFRRKIIELYGQGADERAEERARNNIQYKVFEWMEFEKMYKDKLAELLSKR